MKKKKKKKTSLSSKYMLPYLPYHFLRIFSVELVDIIQFTLRKLSSIHHLSNDPGSPQGKTFVCHFVTWKVISFTWQVIRNRVHFHK